jgi:hypothetical protein
LEGLITHMGDARWREVFLLTASLLDNADAFFSLLKRAIDDLVKRDEHLVALLKWADNKAKAEEGSFQVALLRSFYCGLFLSIIPSNDHALTIDLARARARARNLDIAQLLDHILVIDIDLALDLASARDRELTSDIMFAIELNIDFDLKIDLLLTLSLQFALFFDKVDTGEFQAMKRYISCFSDYFKKVVNLSQQFGSSDLHQALINLTVPNENDRQSAWPPFATILREVMQTQRNIGYEWDLTEKQHENLARYFESNRLLVECLKLAVVSDREGIEGSLLTV